MMKFDDRSRRRTGETDHHLDESGITCLDYDKFWNQYRLKLRAADISIHREPPPTTTLGILIQFPLRGIRGSSSAMAQTQLAG